MGVKFKAVPSDFEERLDDSRPAHEVAVELGLGKAQRIAEKYPEAIVIGGDTIVSIGNHQYGKPENKTEARQMLQEHNGQVALVTTSVVLVCKATGLVDTRYAQTEVLFKPYDEEAAEAYIGTGDWHDKAGAWGIQSGAAPLIAHITGDFDTVVGLPTRLLARMLANVGVDAQPVTHDSPVPQHSKG